MVVVKARRVATHEFFDAVILTSLGSKSGTPLLPESLKTCQYYFDGLTTNPPLLELCRDE